MQLSELTAISPIDGRYYSKSSGLREIFSEYGLIKNRLIIEIRWLQALANCPQLHEITPFSDGANDFLEQLIENFSTQDAQQVKNLEKTTKHDIKAVEYFLKDAIESFPELSNAKEFVHFGCTSEDISNLAYATMLDQGRRQVLAPTLSILKDKLRSMANQYARIPMLSRTHGQPATPTTLGKEIANFVSRLERQINTLIQAPILGKMNGAVGNYNAHMCAYVDIDWLAVSRSFVHSLGLHWNPYTTQIEPHDYMAELFDNYARINTITIDFSRDMWSYIGNDYFTQEVDPNSTGSSTMPHKVNPIHFENAEGNLGIANALLSHFSSKLPISRWQRDLSDSTVLRNIGTAFSHCEIAYQAVITGINKLSVNESLIRADLREHWEVLTEALQTIMRRYGISDAYEELKAFSRGKPMNQEMLHTFIEQSELPRTIKQTLTCLTPEAYTGLAAQLAESV